MRLVIITQYFRPEMGAPQSRLWELAKGLQRLNWEVSVVTALPNYPTGEIFQAYKNKWKSEQVEEGIRIKRFWLFASNSKRALPRILSMLSFSFTVLFSLRFIKRQKPNFIIVESPPLTLAFSARILSVLTRSRWIMNVSDIWPLTAKELGVIKGGFLYRLLVWIEVYLYSRATYCTGQSSEIVEHIRQKTNTRVYLFRNGVDTNRFIETGQFVYQSTPRIVYAGLLGVAQGILAICKNIDFRKLGVEFHIYGSGAEETEIKDFLNNNPDNGILFNGVVERKDIPHVLTGYHAALIPLVRYIYGAVPSKIYEALAAGLPVLFSGSGEGAQIIAQHQVGWVNEPGRWEQLSQNITSLTKMSESDLKKFKSYCVDVARKNFDRNQQIDSLNTFLKNN